MFGPLAPPLRGRRCAPFCDTVRCLVVPAAGCVTPAEKPKGRQMATLCDLVEAASTELGV